MFGSGVVNKIVLLLAGVLLVGVYAATGGSAHRGPAPWPQPEGTPSTYVDENGEPLSPLELWNNSFDEPFFSDEEMAREKAVASIPVEFNEETQAAAGFAGMYISREPLATMTVNFVGDVAPFEALATKYAVTDLVVFREVEHTEAELRALQDRIAGDWEYWRGEGVEFTRVGADPISNRVVIGIVEWTPQVHLRMVQRYGVRIAFVQEGPFSFSGGS